MSTENPTAGVPQEESEDQRLAHGQADREMRDRVYWDYLQTITFSSALDPIAPDDLLFIYRLPGASRESFAQQSNETNQAERERLYRLALEVRDHSHDLSIMLECKREHIANTPEQITPETKAYIGPLVGYDQSGQILPIFQMLPDAAFEHLYTSFPEGKITREVFDIELKSGAQYIEELRAQGVYVYDYVEAVMNDPGFRTLTKKEQVTLLKMKVRDLGFTKDHPTVQQIYDRKTALGLEVSPPEAIAEYRQRYTNQPPGEYIYGGMEPILDPVRNPSVLSVFRHDVGQRYLGNRWARPGHQWYLDDGVLFRIRK